MSSRTFLTSIALMLLIAPAVLARGGRLCFTRGDYIYIREPNGRIKQLIKGYDPAISPDGQTIAFVAVKGEWPKSDAHVSLFDITTGKAHTISTISAHQSIHPVWSPDGRQLAVQLSIDHKPAFATLDPRTEDFCVIPLNFGEFIWLNSWMPDGNSLVATDLFSVVQLGLDGRIIRQLSVRELFGDIDIASSTRFSFSADGRFLLFNSAMVPDDVGIASVYLYDLTNRRLSRLTPDNLGALNPQWLASGKEIIFSGYVKGRYKPKSSIPYWGIYKMSRDGTNRMKLVVDGESPSSSAG